MFEIRVICDPTDSDRVSAALSAAFTTGSVRQRPTHDGQRTRLYITADHRPEPEQRPTPEEAYALAPSIISEIGWTARTAADKPFYDGLNREFWLRKAALLDRIALSDEADSVTSDAADLSTRAAQRLMELDGTAVICDPRRYVRQQYAHWAKNQ
ncbi:hypothetical protein E2C00_20875 [Streptomyces sp. WAC05374]|uniref:hypothetical protein n=1 Tax=Streptomyces sp. WAC05374 TaxID=2487420 RepID=UPI000F8727A7|nr:hypothetical protein [Streptomyces sp. WAC05374]RST19127.1 hypothetical protein EF905_02420 [Streptomyces sp. WAC05374]TDF38104.1 hypothetical protein E2B92_28450 [Streptomyces sp. WAC05374]TDF53563.1 hypothetical protein E2C00_20875 [Streptomyces sp. WAC05374]TDF59410.1 hypothetical protein E2C02_06355 [Streptomyces sp. WAC05374]